MGEPVVAESAGAIPHSRSFNLPGRVGPSESTWRGLLFLAATSGVLVGGCDRGPPRYDVTGSVSYAGRPVPSGRLVFTPDRGKGNPGPQGVARIEAGQILIEQDRRVIGGPHWVQLMAFDGNAYEDGEGTQTHGRPLCPILQAAVDLPREDVELVVEVEEGTTPTLNIRETGQAE